MTFFRCFKMFFLKVIIPTFKEFHRLQNDLKILEKHLTRGRYPERHFHPTKKNDVYCITTSGMRIANCGRLGLDNLTLLSRGMLQPILYTEKYSSNDISIDYLILQRLYDRGVFINF